MAGQLTIDRDYFERMYEADDDPWGFESSFYEQRKFDLTAASLPNAWYRRAFEPGCAIGVLSGRLAGRCAELLCMELMPRIAERARQRLSEFAHVSVALGAIPEDWPPGTFDLVVLSEVLYYLTEAGLALALSKLERSLELGGHLVSTHYLLETDYPLPGAEVHRKLRATPWLREIGCYKEASFEIAVFER